MFIRESCLRRLGGVVAVWERRSKLEEDGDVARKGEVAGDAESSKAVGEVEKGDAKGVEGDVRSFEGGGELVKVDLEKVEGGVRTGGEGTVPNDIVGERLHDDCFESQDGLLAESCGHGVREDGRM